MNSSIESLDRISFIEHQTDSGTVTVTVYWNKAELTKDTTNRRWLRRQIKRIVEHIENDTIIHQYDLFGDSTQITFYHTHHAAQFILEHS